MAGECDLPPTRTRRASRWAGLRAGTTAVLAILGLLAAWAALAPHG